MLKIAFTDSEKSPVRELKTMAWGELSAMLSKPVTSPSKMGAAWIPADIEAGARTGARVQSVSCLVLDVEADTSSDPLTKIKTVIGIEPPAFADMCIELAGDYQFIAHTSHSHHDPAILPADVLHERYRIVFALSRPLVKDEVRPLALHVAALLGLSDCVDTSCMEPARLYFLPRCPADRLSQFRHEVIEGEPLDVDALLEEIRREADALKQATAKQRDTSKPSVIDAFNATYSPGDILEKHGYIPKRKRWMHPNSTTGLPGVRLLPNSTPERIFSSHSNDLLNDGHAHDAFDCYRILEYGGDLNSAVREAARILGMADRKNDPAGLRISDSIKGGDTNATAWPMPQPLTAKIEAEPYPVDALPNTIRAAVEEVGGFVKAPVPMVATSAIAALSLAIQALFDVERASKLHSPVSTFTLVIADSGERKTTCDNFFTQAIRDYEEKAGVAAKPFVKDYNAAIAIWEAKRNGIKDKIRQLAKEKKPTVALEADLCDLEHSKPEAPRIPRLMYGDVTPEELAFKLAMKWPSCGVVSAEAGVVFGSHGMGKDSVTRNLATLNVLWEGGVLQIDRRTTESFAVRGARLTMGLQVQSETLHSFFEKSGALARGTGFLARFLIAWPESTQGNRPFTEAPEQWPSLAAFNRRITEILNQAVPINDDGSLTPLMLTLTPDAKAAWIAYHDAIEGELASGGELFDVRDVASKSADNATRLAALFHVFEGGLGAISTDAFERASRIAIWHLSESRRFFGELALPAEMADAARLDRWLLEHCRRERTHCVARRYAQRHGTVRDGARLDVAITELVSLDRIQLRKDGKQLSIWLNPALMGIGGEP